MIHYTCLLTDDCLKGHAEEKCPPNQKGMSGKENTLVGQKFAILITYMKKISFSLFKYTDFIVKTQSFW